jgi:glutamate carboxypeptidase
VDNNRKNKVCNFIESQKGEMLDRLERIVNMDSGSRDKADVDKVGRVLKGWWEDEGFEIEEVVYNDLGNCYVARFNQNQPGSKIVLIGHFDTVFSAGEVLARPFRIDGDKAYGPAVGDMKSGLITMLYAVKALKEAGSLNGPVSVVLNSHEEIGSVYSREIIESEAKNAGLAINLEAAREVSDHMDVF